jgi:hypothetical protein
MRNDLVVVAGEATSDTFEGCIKVAQALKKGDAAAVVALLVRADAIGLSRIQVEMLLKAIADATGVTLKPLRKAWAKLQAEEERKAWSAGAAERARRAEEDEAQRERERDEERERLWCSCRKIAESKTLLQDFETAAHNLGVVGEGAGLHALYLACGSRLLADDAVRLLRLGAPASGKNAVVEKTLKFIPPDSIVQFSGSSPKALAYYGGDDPDALKHKIVYIPEAAIIADRNGVESDFTIMLRTLISEGRIVYQTVVVQEGGPPETVTIVKNGPIAAVITTARDVDPELKTRVMVMDTDESGAQTVEIVKRILSEPEAGPDLQPWLDFQTWLQMDAPYRVKIPFKQAIFDAFERWRKDFLLTAALRMRRDVNNLLSAVKASAVLHRAQRDVADDGAIVATLDDYAAAHAAFDDGLAGVHGKASDKVIAVVAAIDAMREGADLPVKVTLRDLAIRLRVASPSTAGGRLNAAIDFGAIEQDDALTGRGGARYFRVAKTEKEIRAQPGLGVFPPVEFVRESFAGPHPPVDAGQNEQMNKPGTRARI